MTDTYQIISVPVEIADLHPTKFALPVAADDIDAGVYITTAQIFGDPPMAHPMTPLSEGRSPFSGAVMNAPVRKGESVKIVAEYYFGQPHSVKVWVIMQGEGKSKA